MLFTIELRVSLNNKLAFMTKKSIPYPNCYAKHLGGCDSKSAEHYISQSILEAIGPFVVKGLPWLKQAESKVVSSNALTASVLCRRHNSLLSDFDLEAAKLIKHLKLIDSKETAIELERAPLKLIIDGLKLEKWFLKTFCAVTASGNYLIDGKGHGSLPISEYAVNLLYKDAPWKVGIGLYSGFGNRDRVNAFKGIGFDPVTARSGTEANVVGIDVHFWGFPLRGLFAVYENNHPLEGYRPRGITFVNGSITREIIFQWPPTSVTSDPPICTRVGTIYPNNTKSA